MFFLLMFSTLALANEETINAKFKLSTVYDTESPWGPKPGEEWKYIMKISCLKYLDPMPLQSPWKSTTTPDIIHIHNCTLPTTPLAEAFKRLDLDTRRLDKLILTDSRIPPHLPEDYNAGLFYYRIELSNVTFNTNSTLNFFTSLKKRYKMTVENMEMPLLKANVSYTDASGHLLGLTLRNTTVKRISNCEMIETLVIKDTEEDQISQWPEGCGGRLNNLQLESLSPATVNKVITIRPYLPIQSLTIRNCSLVKLPVSLMKGIGSGYRVFRVDLPNNNLEDEAFLQFPKLEDLGFLDLSYNRLTGECLRKILPYVGSSRRGFERLTLDGNNFTDIFDDYDIKSALVSKKSLLYLYLNFMELEPDCLRHSKFSYLQYLGLASNSSKLIENLQLHDLPSTGGSQLTVDLRGRPVRTIRIGPNFTGTFEELDKPDHWLKTKGYKLVILLDFVDCECNNAALQYALKHFPQHLYMPALRCDSKNGGFFLEEPLENLNCRKATVNGCKRRLSREQNYTTVMDCSNIGDKFLWPMPQRLRGLNASGNDISLISKAHLPDSLEWIDLRYNNITKMSTEDLSRLFATPGRRVWLSENPFNCILCENRDMIEVLQSKHTQIVDYQNLKCLTSFTPKTATFLKKIFLFEFCKTGYVDNDNVDRELGTSKGQRSQHEKKIFCSTTLDAAEPITMTEEIDTISLYKCIMPRVDIEYALRSLNIEVQNITTLRLIDVIMSPTIPRHYSAKLGIRNLELIDIKTQIPYNLFQHLGSLRRLVVENSIMPELVSSNGGPLFQLTVKNSSVKAWTNCKFLQNVKITNMAKEQVPDEWPGRCTGGLRYLSLKDMTPEAAMKFIASVNETSLFELIMQNCSLKETPLRLLKYLNRLKVLDLSHNGLEDQAFSQFPDVKDLRILNLSHNKLTGEFLIEVIPKVPELRELILDGNHFVHIFRNLNIKTAMTSLASLERLSLNDMTFDVDCLENSNFTNLKLLELRANEEQKILLRLYGLPRTGASQLTIDITGRSFRSVKIDYDFYVDFENRSTTDFWLTNKGYNLIVKLDYIDCVCNNDVLSTTLRDFSSFLSMPDLKCDSKDGGLFSNEQLKNLNCMKATVHGCRRRISRHYDYFTTVDCSYNTERFRWPRPDKRYYGLNASGNHITTLRNAYLPDTLKVLDLSNNNISRLNANHTALLFNSMRQIRLAGNPIVCHCDNQILLNALRTNHTQIADYDVLTCADSAQLVRLVSVEELCRFKLEYVWWSSLALAALALIAALLLRHYWIPLRMYLYSRGYCLSCLNEDDMDEDRPYDAFLSFAHADNQYVMEQLLPQLEGEPNFYRICIHYRDWSVGEWIPAQIMQSIRLSKRTIIILSKNFVKSLWGAMEFRYSLAAMESEGRSRILVLILDEVLSENLTPELRNYLNLNTYLMCDDPWFWEKLRFAMPRNQRSPRGHEERVNNASVIPSQLMPMENVDHRNNPNQSAPVNDTDVEEGTNDVRTV